MVAWFKNTQRHSSPAVTGSTHRASSNCQVCLSDVFSTPLLTSLEWKLLCLKWQWQLSLFSAASCLVYSLPVSFLKVRLSYRNSSDVLITQTMSCDSFFSNDSKVPIYSQNIRIPWVQFIKATLPGSHPSCLHPPQFPLLNSSRGCHVALLEIWQHILCLGILATSQCEKTLSTGHIRGRLCHSGLLESHLFEEHFPTILSKIPCPFTQYPFVVFYIFTQTSHYLPLEHIFIKYVWYPYLSLEYKPCDKALYILLPIFSQASRIFACIQ